jgi:hypothetical protein
MSEKRPPRGAQETESNRSHEIISNVITMMKSRWVRFAWHIACMEEKYIYEV